MRCSPTTSTRESSNPTLSSWYEQSASVTARATSRFDNAADACFGYFNSQGYSALANVLVGTNNKNESVLGWQFCDNIDGELKRAAPVTTTSGQLNVYNTPGLSSILASPTPYGDCNVRYSSIPSYSAAPRRSSLDWTSLVCSPRSQKNGSTDICQSLVSFALTVMAYALFA
jgi:hypothetical protein